MPPNVCLGEKRNGYSAKCNTACSQAGPAGASTLMEARDLLCGADAYLLCVTYMRLPDVDGIELFELMQSGYAFMHCANIYGLVIFPGDDGNNPYLIGKLLGK